MAFGQPQSYSQWFQQNQALVEPVIQRYAQPAPAAAPVQVAPVEVQAPAAAPAASPWAPPPNFDEAAFQRDIRAHPWYTEFQKKYGEAPNLEDPDYDYRSAWAAGIRPEIYKHDGTYHWSSSLPNGQMLKSENHPTAWMEHFMRATGVDPNDLGLKSKEEGDAYLAKQQSGGVKHVDMLPKGGNPYQQLYDAQSDRVGNVNEQVDSIVREGESKAQGARDVAAKEQEYATGAKQVQDAAEGVNAHHRAEKDRLLEERMALMRELDQPIKGLSSGKKVASMIAGIIGAASMGGGGTGSNPNQGMGAMMNMMQGYIQSSAQKELEERAQKSQRIQARDEMIDLLSKDGSNELDLSNKILANRWFIAAKEADAIAKANEGTQYGEQARQAAIAMRDKGSAYVEGIAQQRIAAAEAKKKLAMKSANERYWTMPLSDLMALNQGVGRGLPSEAQKILAQRIKNDQDLRGGEAKIGGDLADAQKKALAAAGGGVAAPAGETIADEPLYSQTTDKEKEEFRAKQRDTKDLKDSIAFIRKILKKSGTEAWGAEAAKLRTYAGTLMGQYNRGAKFGAMDNGTMGLLTDVLGDPTALTTGGPTALAKLDAVEKSADSSLDNHRVTVGLASRDPSLLRSRNAQPGAREGTTPAAPAQEAPAVAGPPPAQATQTTVTMVLPMTGQRVQVPADRPDLVEGMRQRRGAVTLEEYQDAERQQQFEAEQGQNALAYQEGR